VIRGRRLLLYALLALAVPLPALALQGGDSGPQSLSVSASLSGCGLAQTTIMCEIDASWSGIDGADSYTASVTAPDGSVTDFGSVGAGSASVYVPYVGDGTYSVQVTAWGSPEEPGADPRVIARENSSPTADPGASATDPGVDPGTLSVKPQETAESSEASSPADDPGSDAAMPDDPTATTPTEPVEPPIDCTTTPPAEPTVTPDPAAAGTTDDASSDDSAGETTTTTEATPPPAPPVDPACP
jgi:hypothetical protein